MILAIEAPQDSCLFLLQPTTWLPLWTETGNPSFFKRPLGLAMDCTDSADLIAVIFLPLSFYFLLVTLILLILLLS